MNKPVVEGKPHKARAALGIVLRVVLASVALFAAVFAFESFIWSDFKQWQVYLSFLGVAVLTGWLAARGLPLGLGERKAPGPVSSEPVEK